MSFGFDFNHGELCQLWWSILLKIQYYVFYLICFYVASRKERVFNTLLV